MKIQVKASELAKKMQRALGVVQAKVTIPALAYVKLDVTNATQATLSGSDLGMSMIQSVSISLVSSEAGSMLLPARTLDKQLNCLPSDAIVTIETEGKNLNISSGKLLKSKLSGLDVALFPPIEPRVATQFNINAAALKKVISQVETASPSKAGRTAVPSIQLESTAGYLRAAGTDGFQIAVADVKGGGAGDFTIQLPKTFLPLMKEIPGEVIQFSQSETNYFFATENENLLIRIPTTKFPAYQKVLTLDEYVTEFDVAVPSLKSALGIIAATQDTKSPAVWFDVNNGELNLTSSAAEGSSESTIEVSMNPKKSQPNKIKLNQTFLNNFLGQVEGSIKIQMVNATSLVRLSSGDDYLYFIMPMLNEVPKAEEKKEAKSKAKA